MPGFVFFARVRKKTDLLSKAGEHPVTLVFARDVSLALGRLVKKLDAILPEHTDSKLTGLIVLCSDGEDQEAKLKDLAADTRHVVLAVSLDKSAGPRGYHLAKDAHLTMVILHKRQVKASYAFRAGELTDESIDESVAAVARTARSIHLSQVGDRLAAYTPKKNVNTLGGRKCETC